MKSRLDLTEAQLPKVEALNLKYAEKLDPVIEDRPDRSSRWWSSAGNEDRKRR
jgi:hypothetical protein